MLFFSYREAIGVRGTLEPSLELENHPGIDLDGDDLLAGFEKLLRQVTGPGTDLEDDVGALDAGLLHNGIDEQGVLENVLTL